MSSRKDKNEKNNIIPILLLFLSGFFVFLFFSPSSKPKAVVSEAKSKEFEAKVNKHLFQTSQQMELGREKMQIEASQIANTGVKPLPGPTEEASGVDFSTDPRAEALVRDLGRNVKESNGPKNPHEMIQTELFQQDQLQQYSEEYKAEYARQFVENAKRAGYKVILNDQYKVMSVAPIRKPAQDFKLFDPNSSTAQ